MLNFEYNDVVRATIENIRDWCVRRSSTIDKVSSMIAKRLSESGSLFDTTALVERSDATKDAKVIVEALSLKAVAIMTKDIKGIEEKRDQSFSP